MDLTLEIKKRPKHFKNSLSERLVAGVFQNPSFYTTFSFQVAVSSLKGCPVVMQYSDIQPSFKTLSPVTYQCLEQWVDGVFIETNNHSQIRELGKALKVPVINAGSEIFSPCQALADFFTIKENYRDLTDIKLAFIGSQKSLCHSLLLASALSGAFIHIAGTPESRPEQKVIEAAEIKGKQTGFNYKITENPLEAASNADIVYCSYSNPNLSLEVEKKLFSIDSLFSRSQKDSLFMTSIPSEEWQKRIVQKIPSNRSLIYSQADNRLHIQKAIMVSLIRNKKREK